ncbi:MAG TPA: helix-turn-helix domain-containing protein [Candidatus Monoglobus merdigallinarum]|uniref:Helix-turn-helix domain-containing protein n=1 Tax=Candidatus Monoglobus merdigallinarum TaxID=2838698 RepID=A0A9D1TLS9_9FIRM|nr:helix-turn-helix domain-containing protein [Candidatus Monoglobus merdigallinarum]
MANKDLSKKLKQARLNNGLTQKEVYDRFKIKQARFSAWENGISEPDVKTFLELCKTYGIDDIYSYFCAPDTKYNSTEMNAELAQAVLKLKSLSQDEDCFRAVLNCLDFEYNEYLNKRVVKFEGKRRILPVYMQPAAAGLGNYITDDKMELMELPAPPEADAGIRISGDSMEPDICDGEIVYIKFMPYVAFGDIGIFIYRGEAYCKKLDKIGGRPCLTSINPQYLPIYLNEDEPVSTVGKVII